MWLIFAGWDISSLNLAGATERAQVLDSGLQRQLRPYLEKLKPRPSIYCPDFIAANQADRADNVLSGTKQEMLEQIRMDIQDFKQKNYLDKVTYHTGHCIAVRVGKKVSFPSSVLGATVFLCTFQFYSSLNSNLLEKFPDQSTSASISTSQSHFWSWT